MPRARLNRIRHARRGLTLVEMLVAFAIVIILGILGFMTYDRFNMVARDNQRLADLRRFQEKLEEFRNIHGVYPCGWNADDANPTNADGSKDGSSLCPSDPLADIGGFLNGSENAPEAWCDAEPYLGLYHEGLLPTNCPRDPLNLETSGGSKIEYQYNVTEDRKSYLLSAYIEAHPDWAADDGGLCSMILELGPSTGVIEPEPLGVPVACN